jgi:hypothetical protein
MRLSSTLLLYDTSTDITSEGQQSVAQFFKWMPLPDEIKVNNLTLKRLVVNICRTCLAIYKSAFFLFPMILNVNSDYFRK